MNYCSYLRFIAPIITCWLMGLSFTSQAQFCDSDVPTFNVDLSASPVMNWTSPPVVRDGNCCGTTAPDNCLEFVITLHPAAIAVNFMISSGAVPPGALFYQINCGPPTPVGSPICLTGPGPHTLTFCKPGNNTNTFSIVSFSAPIFGPDITLNAACQGFIYANYYNEPTVNWTSIFPGAPGTYDGLLSCTLGCDTTFITAPIAAPPYIDYLVCGMDVNACDPNPICDTIRVNFVPPVGVTITSPIMALCPGATTTITANPVGGSGAYTLTWSNGGSGLSQTVGPGTYTVDVVDTSGCFVANAGITIAALPLPLVNAGPDVAVCENSSVTLTGAGAVSYVWDNGVVNGVPFVPAVGTLIYTVTGTDANGCVNTDQVSVTVNPLPIVNAGVDQTVCANTAVTLSGAGAVGYVWDNGAVNGIPFVPAVGTVVYTVTGTDANGCVDTDQVSVTVNPLPLVNAGADQTVCANTAVTLSGAGAVGYVWDNGVVNGVPFVPAVGTLVYTVTGTDANGCVNTDQVSVTVNPLPVVNAGVDQTVCANTAVTLSGAGAVSYVWNNGVVNGVPIVPAVGTLVYTVTGTDANGCVNTDQVSVTVNPLPVVNAGVDQTVCANTAVTLSGAGAVGYVWDNGVVNGVPFVPVVGTLVYTVTGTDANGCVDTDQVSVTVNPLPLVNAGADQTVCANTAVTLSGAGAVSYVWNNGVVNGVPFVPAVGTLVYTVTGTDANGCVNTDQVSVTVNPLPAVNAGVDQTVCANTAVTLSGAGAVSYVWNNGVVNGVPFVPAVGTLIYTVTGTDANGCVNTDQVNVTVNPLPVVNAGVDQTVCANTAVTLSGAGAVGYVWNNGVVNGVPFVPAVGTLTYTVTGTDANGCVDTDQVNVTVHPLPAVNAGVDQTVCANTAVTLSGAGAVGYVWNNGVVNGVPFVPAVGTLVYTVTGTDANGCVNTDQVSVTVNPLPAVNAGVDQTVCANTAVTLSGAGAVGYVWNNGVVNGVPFVPAVGTLIYTVTGTDANGCVNTDQVSVTVNPLPVVNAGVDQTVCANTAVTLSGAGAVGYVWNNGVVNGVPFVPAVGTLTYTVTGTDANGCVDTDQVNVTVHPLPAVNAGVDQTVCANTAVTLSGAGAVGYVWNNGVVNGVPFVPAVGTLVYTVTGTDANGCVNTDQVSVTVNPLPAVNAGVDQTICVNTSVTLSGAGASVYVWDNGVVDGVPFVPAVGTIVYTVTGTDANGCVNTDQVKVTVNALPSVNAGADFSVCEGTMITLSAVGSPALSWNNGVVNNVPFLQAIGTVMYVLHDTNLSECTSSDTVYVEVLANPVVTALGKEICAGEGVVLNGMGAVSYSWDNGVFDGVEFFPTVTNNYTVTGTAANGCTAQRTVEVIVHAAPNVDFKILNFNLTTSNPTTGFDNISSGATSFNWDFGDGSSNSSDFEPVHSFPTDHSGEYAITLTGYSEFGCPDTRIKYVHVFQDYTIYVPNAFTPDGSGVNEVFKPVMDGFDEDEYTMYIFNRWGDLIFETHNMEVGWDGKFAGQEFQVQDNVYVWKIIAGLKDSPDSKIFVGHVTILK